MNAVLRFCLSSELQPQSRRSLSHQFVRDVEPLVAGSGFRGVLFGVPVRELLFDGQVVDVATGDDMSAQSFIPSFHIGYTFNVLSSLTTPSTSF